jgi:Flp pilus assembly protein TadB
MTSSWGLRLATMAQSVGLATETLGRDLHTVGRTVQEHSLAKIEALAGGLVAPVAFAGITRFAGVAISPVVVAVASLALGAGGFLAVDIALQREAERRRRQFRSHFSTYLGLVTQGLAGGAGIETALADAAALGDSWGFDLIASGLAEARLANKSPWVVLERLGEQHGLAELEELAGTLALAGAAGARIRESLQVRAASLIEHELTESEAEAGSVTENMSVPIGLMSAAFMVVLGFPALYRIALL